MNLADRPEMVRDIVERLKIIRTSLGKNDPRSTQEGFAQSVHFHRNTVGRYERGIGVPDIEFCANVCTIYGVSPIWLYLGFGDMQATASIDKAEKAIFLDSERQKNQGYCSGCAALERALDKERLERQALATENKDLNFMVGKLEAQVEAMEKREERPEADNEAKSA